MCNAKYNKAGEAKIVKQDIEHTCDVSVTIEHDSGCTVASILGLTTWLNEQWWFAGSCFIVLGLSIGMAGRKLEKFMVALIGALIMLFGTLTIASIRNWL